MAETIAAAIGVPLTFVLGWWGRGKWERYPWNAKPKLLAALPPLEATSAEALRAGPVGQFERDVAERAAVWAEALRPAFELVAATSANYWWAEHDPENALSPDYPWRPTLQVGSGMCISLEGVSFGSEEDCLDFIRTDIFGAGLDPKADLVRAKLSDGVAEIASDEPLSDATVRAIHKMGYPIIRRKGVDGG